MKRFWESRWRDSLIIMPPLLFIAWITYGFVFSHSLFNQYLNNLAVLHDLDVVFGYIGVLFAVQIPVFILLLEKMNNAGYVRRLVLPSVISFREVLVGYVVLSFLLLISPRASYLYFPTIALTMLCIYALVEAVRVIFETRKLKEREYSYISKLVQQALSASLKGRNEANDFFATTKKFPFVSHALLDIGARNKETYKYYPIRMNRRGIVSSIDVKRLNDLMATEYQTKVSRVRGGRAKDIKQDKKDAKIILHTRPNATIEKQDEVILLVLETGLGEPTKRFTTSLLDCIKTTHDHPDSANRQMDDLVKDFRQQLHEAIDKDDSVLTDDALNIYELLTDGLVALQFTEDSGYDLEAARGEFSRFFSDDVSERLRLITDIIDDEFFYALRTQKQDAVNSLVSSMYRSILKLTSTFNVLTVARAERAFTHAISRLIYSDKTTLADQQYRQQVLRRITSRLKEHTSLLLYNYREYNDSFSFTKKQLTQWIETRLNDMMSFMLGAYKNSQVDMFSNIKAVFDTIEDDYSLYDDRVEEFAWMARCRLFMVAAYIHGKSNITQEQLDMKKLLDKYLSKLSANDLTRILVTCIDNDYADKWRLDTHDLVADGKMHTVPDFNLNLKSLWIEYMLQLGDKIPTDIHSYDENLIATTGAFSDLMTDSEKAFIPRHLEKLEEEGKNITKLRKLVEDFIEQRHNWEDGELVEAELDQDMIAKFKDEVLASYKESALSLSVYRKTERLKFVNRATKGFLSFGWNQIQDKYGFIKDWHIGVGHQTHEYGNQIARAENRHILESLLNKRNTKIEDFELWIKKLRRHKTKTWFIVSIGVAGWYMTYHRGDDIGKQLVENHTRGDMKFKGLNQIAPIYYTYEKHAPKGLYAILSDDIGVLEIKGSEKYPVKISIDPYSHDDKLLKAIIKSPPDWLKEKGDKDAQESFLKTKVRMLIQHPFRYIPSRKPTIYYYPVADKDSD